MDSDVGDSTAVALFPPMYRRAAPMQASLALVGSVSGLAAWLTGLGVGWLAGALLPGFVIPFTLLVLKPVNDKLMSPDLDPSSPEAADLLERWARLHWVRTGTSALSFVVFLVA